MIVNKTKVRKIFNNSNIQISIDALNFMDDYFNREVTKMVNRAISGNIKRVSVDTVVYILPSYGWRE